MVRKPSFQVADFPSLPRPLLQAADGARRLSEIVWQTPTRPTPSILGYMFSLFEAFLRDEFLILGYCLGMQFCSLLVWSGFFGQFFEATYFS